MDPRVMPALAIDSLQKRIHQCAVDHGFWYEVPPMMPVTGGISETAYRIPWNFGEKVALIHSELSEALEKHRKTLGKGKADEPDEHCPEFGGIAIELADVVIRVMDLAEKMGVELGEAILAKVAFNEIRPHKHGKAY